MDNKTRCKERYYWLKEHGICVHCGKDNAMINNILCPECAEKHDKSTDKCRIRNEEYRIKDVEIYKRMADRREEQGLCRRCGKRPPMAGKKQCIECKVARHKRYLQKELKQNMTKREEKEYLNKCRICGAVEVVEGKKVCKECYERCSKQAEFARSKVDYKNHIWRNQDKLTFNKI